MPFPTLNRIVATLRKIVPDPSDPMEGDFGLPPNSYRGDDSMFEHTNPIIVIKDVILTSANVGRSVSAAFWEAIGTIIGGGHR